MTLQRIDNGKGHWYKLDGEKADGVTTLIGSGVPKPALINWAANTTAEYAIDNWSELADMPASKRLAELKAARFAALDKAARRGTEVHKLAEKLLQDEEVEVPDELAGHVESYVKFLDTWQPTPVLVEAQVASRKWRYCGTVDMVVDLPDGRRMIADIKTSRSGIFGETVLQLAAYRYAEFYLDADKNEQSVADLGIVGALAIWVRSDGYDVYELPADEYQHNRFLHVATVARWTKNSRDLIGPAVQPTWEEKAA